MLAGSGEEASVSPGSMAAEAMADALLMRAKACGVRVARVLMAAARGERTGAGLRRAARAILLSCAYTTERGLRKRCRAVMAPGTENLDASWRVGSSRQSVLDWLAQAIDAHPEALAESVGLRGRQAQVWIARARGESVAEIAAELGLGRAVVYRHLARAQAQVDQSWLAAYWGSLRRCGR